MTDRSPTPAQVAVKPLEWRIWKHGRFEAESIFGLYQTWSGHFRKPGEVRGNRCEDPEAAAQADYEARIRSALIPAAEQEPVAGYDPACPDCKGTGERDSGGTHPWGAPAMLPCDCDTHAPVPAVPDDVAKIVAELREWDHCWPAPWLEGSVRKAADALDAQAAELARLRGFAEFVTTWAISFRTSDRDETVWTTDQWRELRRQIAALQPTGD